VSGATWGRGPGIVHHDKLLAVFLQHTTSWSISWSIAAITKVLRRLTMNDVKPSRRKFLAGAAAAGAAGTALGFPAISRAQSGPITLRMQSTWPSNDIFHEFAVDFAKKVNDMAEGQLRIEVLPAGAVVPAFNLLDAVSAGTLDAGHGVVAYWYGKNSAVALWGSGPAFGLDANLLLAWHEYGGGKELLAEIQQAMGVNVTSL